MKTELRDQLKPVAEAFFLGGNPENLWKTLGSSLLNMLN